MRTFSRRRAVFLVAFAAATFLPASLLRAQQAAAPPAKAADAAAAAKKKELTVDDLFPRKPFFGRPAQRMAWSHDDRYLAYLWKPYDDKGGMDLYLYDTKEGKSR